MRRLGALLAAIALGCATLVLAHYALIEVGREVVVLRTRSPDGGWLETRLWIVDDGGLSWLHGGDSRWMANLRARPIVEIVRGGAVHRYRATAIPGPHPRLHELLRAKYGIADGWVRLLGPDRETTTAVRLELVDGESERED